ncbi:MAG: M20/M25/M40 family metallo-hydrolase [Acidobacteriota bacterium]|nr:M20/M25/M40 family metallo-hydrolase [Acidobacteriota bacterium]
MSTRRYLLGVVVIALAAGAGLASLRAQQPAASPYLDTDRKILDEVKDHNQIMANLGYLSDMIGPRLTGSSNLDKANHWTADKFREYGLANVHLEPWTIDHAWYRGTAEARIVSPAVHPISLAAEGWSPGTKGAVHGPVVYVEAKNEQELDAYRGKLKNAIVITSPPPKVPGPYQAPEQPEERPYHPPFELPAFLMPQKPGQPKQPSPFEFFRKETAFFKQEGVAVILRDSFKPDALLTMTGEGGSDFHIGPLPVAFIPHEDYLLIWRLLQRGPVQMEVNIQTSFSPKPVTVYNTVAELPGADPNQVVIIGAHLDSWDLAEGSTDNGTGSMVILEAARALKALGIQPKRTIRFVLFTGEEEGLVGSRRYVQAHRADMDKIDAVLVHDTGSGRVLTLGLHGNYQDREVVDHVLAPLDDLGLGLIEPSLSLEFGTDHASFNEAGVPGFWCVQDPYNYPRTHHSQVDTFDMANQDNLVEGAQVVAAWAWNTAEWPEMMPRMPLSKEPKLPF